MKWVATVTEMWVTMFSGNIGIIGYYMALIREESNVDIRKQRRKMAFGNRYVFKTTIAKIILIIIIESSLRSPKTSHIHLVPLMLTHA